jgi:hypothetical protein
MAKAKKLDEVALPTSLAAFDGLVEQVCAAFKFEGEVIPLAATVISATIRQLPRDQAHTHISYLGKCVIKHLANSVCQHKSEVLKHRWQVDTLAQTLESDPGNIQAYDELTKAANDGSEYAKDALARLESGGMDFSKLTRVPSEGDVLQFDPAAATNGAHPAEPAVSPEPEPEVPSVPPVVQ